MRSGLWIVQAARAGEAVETASAVNTQDVTADAHARHVAIPGVLSGSLVSKLLHAFLKRYLAVRTVPPRRRH